ncbi:hypothetical protein MRB53_009399 [Persea americana]|uniref:Uncharacterized protein n=1 Tax=Persea americana TaxID=3435 RepID=A0ACC2LPX6_PERAE|nr:hypothetical protein MRB53_009399 [Persea americana]
MLRWRNAGLPSGKGAKHNWNVWRGTEHYRGADPSGKNIAIGRTKVPFMLIAIAIGRTSVPFILIAHDTHRDFYRKNEKPTTNRQPQELQTQQL